jgi:hypothetical protein
MAACREAAGKPGETALFTEVENPATCIGSVEMIGRPACRIAMENKHA